MIVKNCDDLEKLRSIAFDILDISNRLGKSQSMPETPIRKLNENLKSSENLPNLASLARAEYQSRKERAKFFDEDLFGEPSWDILLDLFIQTLSGKRITVTSVCIASRTPATTGLRYVAEMEKRSMLVREQCEFDHRRSYISLAPSTFNAICRYFGQRESILLTAKWVTLAEAGLIIPNTKESR